MLAGAVRAYLNRWAVAPRRAAVFTACDDGWRTAADLAAAGVEVVALIDARPGGRRRRRGRGGCWPGPRSSARAGAGRCARSACGSEGRVERLAVDCLAVSGGWNPNVQLTCHLGARPVWDARRAAFVPATGAVPGMAVAGAAAGGLLDGGGAAAGGGGGGGGARRSRCRRCRRRRTARARRRPSGSSRRRGGPSSICRTTSRSRILALAVREGFGRAEHAKRYTTLGMATDQGRTGGVVGPG